MKASSSTVDLKKRTPRQSSQTQRHACFVSLSPGSLRSLTEVRTTLAQQNIWELTSRQTNRNSPGFQKNCKLSLFHGIIYLDLTPPLIISHSVIIFHSLSEDYSFLGTFSFIGTKFISCLLKPFSLFLLFH